MEKVKRVKLAVIGTTINGEKGYLPFDELAAKSPFKDVAFVIAGDIHSKPFDVSKFKCRVEYQEPKDQERFAISSIIGWRTPRRRPAAWLRAIELAPDFILSVDDDNIPAPDYFATWYRVLTEPVAREAVAADSAASAAWHNYLAPSDAPIEIFPRGFPYPFRGETRTVVRESEPRAPEKVALWQGISLGDPDMDAMARLVWPARTPLRSIGEKNYALENVWSPYNMQNTVYAPALFGLPILWPFAGRFDDIYASFAFQRLMFTRGLAAHVGDPVNRQDRGVRDTLRGDFREEIDGYQQSHDVWAEIHAIDAKEPMQFLGRLIRGKHPTIQKHREFFEAYRNDIGNILT